MDGACGMQSKEKKSYKFLVEKPEVKRPCEISYMVR